MVRQMGEVETPGRVLVRLVCPECDVVQAVEMEVVAELKVVDRLDGDTIASLTPKVKAQKAPHICRQTTMDDIVT